MSDTAIKNAKLAEAANALIDDAAYQEKYARSIADPDAFWREEAQRIDCAIENAKPLSSPIYNPLSAPSVPPCEKVPCLKLRGSGLKKNGFSTLGITRIGD